MSNPITSPSTIAKIAEDSINPRISLDHTLGFGTACYDAGAKEILKHIAELEIDKGIIYISEFTTKKEQETESAYNTLLYRTQGIEKPLLNEFYNACQAYSASESQDYFIEGFVRGYCYLKHYITHFKGGLI